MKETQSSHWFSVGTIVFFCLFIVSCSSTDPNKKNIVTTKALPVVVEQQDSVEALLSKATEQNKHQAVSTLLQASQLLIKQQQFEKSLWLINEIKPLIANDNSKRDLLLLQSRAFVGLKDYKKAKTSFQQLNTLYEENQIEQYPSAYYEVEFALATYFEAPVQAVIARLYLLDKLTPAPASFGELWQQLSLLTDWQLAEVAKATPPHVKGWLSLLQLAHHYGSQPLIFSKKLVLWQQQFPVHPANILIDKIKANNEIARPENYQHIAVLLPLTGQQKSAGEAIQQGIIAAANKNLNTELHFIDTNEFNFSTLTEHFAEDKIDFVIGPLLKGNVRQYLAQQIALPTLLLNSSGELLPESDYVVFSLQPEQESIQAAETLSRKKFHTPLVLSHDDPVSKRITNTFVQHWYKNTHQKPEVMFYNNSKAMQKSLQLSMDVSESKARINELKRQLNLPIKTETRNRRDIDMIYVVGNAAQTRLLKPYIDINISPFAQAIPVYSSSKSHSALQDRKDIRDLTGLTFTEMPWLLSSKQQNKSLYNKSVQLWPERSDSLQRIFALGFDAYQLTSILPLMKQLPYIRFYGQTGVLQLDKEQIKRSLIWGKYNKRSVHETPRI